MGRRQLTRIDRQFCEGMQAVVCIVTLRPATENGLKSLPGFGGIP